MDIGDAEFTDLTNYRFAIDAVPEWLIGSTAIPTDRVLRAIPDADAGSTFESTRRVNRP